MAGGTALYNFIGPKLTTSTYEIGDAYDDAIIGDLRRDWDIVSK